MQQGGTEGLWDSAEILKELFVANLVSGVVYSPARPPKTGLPSPSFPL